MKKLSFSERAKIILQKESDPKLQMDLLEALANEQEQYKAAHGMGDMQQTQQPSSSEKIFPGTEPYPSYITYYNNEDSPMVNTSSGINGDGYGNISDGNRLNINTDQFSGLYGESGEFRNTKHLGQSKSSLFGNQNYKFGQNDPNRLFGFDSRTKFLPNTVGYDSKTNQLTHGNSDSRFYTLQNDESIMNPRKAQRFANKMNKSFIPGSDENKSWMQNHPKTAAAAGFGLQIAPSIASGIISSIGNNKMKRAYNDLAEGMKGKYTHAKAYIQTPEQISLERERSSARKEAGDVKGAAFYDLKNTSRTRGEYLAGASNLTSKIQRNLSNTLSVSYQNEAQMNAAERSRVNAANAAMMTNTSQFNAQQDTRNLQDYYNLKGQALGYKAGQYNVWQGVGQDIMKISNQNQMISSLGDHYGYTRPNWYRPNQWNIKYKNGNRED